MAELWDRRQQRVDFHANVRLLPPEQDQVILAKAGNISETGLFVTSPDAQPVGTEVLCDVPLPGEARTLRGRVAWLKQAAQEATASGMGIEFLDLSAVDRWLLRRFIGPSRGASEPVLVRFPGFGQPIQAQAVATDDGLRFRMALPFLRVDAPLQIQLADGSAVDRSGRIEQLALELGADRATPCLDVHVRFADLPSVDILMDDAEFDDELDEPALVVELTAELPPAALYMSATTATSPQTLVSAVSSGVVSGTIESAGTQHEHRGAADAAADSMMIDPTATLVDTVRPAALYESIAATGSHDGLPLHKGCTDAAATVQLPAIYATPAPACEPSPANPTGSTAAQSQNRRFWREAEAGRRRLWVWVAALLVVAGAAASLVSTRIPEQVAAKLLDWLGQSPARPSAVIAVGPPPASVDPRASAKPDDSPPADENTSADEPTTPRLERARSHKREHAAKSAARPSGATRAPASPARGRLEVQVKGGQASLLVGLSGSTRDAQQYRLADPDGIVVNLPHARALLPHGTYPLNKSGFRQVWVRPRGSGVQLRFFFSQSSSGQQLQLRPTGVRVTLGLARAAADE